MKAAPHIIGIFLFIFLLATKPTFSQQVGTRIDFFGYADNREYTAPYTTDKTYFGTILSPQLYLKLQENHYLYGGVHYKQEFGISPENKSKFDPIAYYNYKSERIDFALGFMPRYQKLNDMSRIVLSDTLFYDRPNIQGMYFNYQYKGVSQSIFIDWLSKQGAQTKERFIAGISGKYTFGAGYFANQGTLYHNALTSSGDPEEHIQDNAILVLRLGVDLSKYTFLDSVSIDAGAVVGFDRLRTEYEHSSKGFISDIHLAYKKFFVHNTLYLGQAINVPNGDSFYHRDKYDRIDLGWMPFQGKNIDAKLTASFHVRPGGVDNQQAFTLRYHFDESLWKK